MLSLPPAVRILLVTQPVDLRKRFDGLAQLVQSVLAEDPFSGPLFVFRNRCGNRLKILYWASDGFALWYRQLEQGSFRLPVPSEADATSVPVKAADLLMLLEGVDLNRIHRRPRYLRESAEPATDWPIS